MLRKVVGALGTDLFSVDFRLKEEHIAVADVARIGTEKTVPAEDIPIVEEPDKLTELNLGGFLRNKRFLSRAVVDKKERELG